MRATFCLGLLISIISACLETPVCQADVLFNDGQSHTVDGLVDDYVEVSNAAGGFVTTVTFESGASVTGTDRFDDSVFVNGDSIVNVRGGRFVDDVSAYQRSELNISGGQFLDDIFATNRAVVNLSGGVVADDLEAFGNSRVVMTGGSIGEDVEAVGGSIQISGGIFSAGGINNLDAGLGVARGGSIELIGSDFRLDGHSIGFGDLMSESGFLSGILADGTAFSDIPFTRNLLDNGDLGTLTISAIPEPSSVLILTAGALIVIERRRRRKALPRK